MTIGERDTIRELSTMEIDQIGGGKCQCGNNDACVTKGKDGHWYTCGGLQLAVGPGGR